MFRESERGPRVQPGSPFLLSGSGSVWGSETPVRWEEARKALCGVCKQVNVFIQRETQRVTCSRISGVVTTFRGGS